MTTRIWTPSQVANLQRTGRASWYSIEASASGSGTATEILIYDEIGEWGVTASSFLRDLGQVKGAIDLHLNSAGGEVFDGIAIYETLKQRGGVTVYVDSLAASISSVIAQAGERRIMAPNATMMVHDASSGMAGNGSELRKLADLLDKTSDNIASVYAERAGGSAADWRTVMQATTWYSAAEAVAAGLADEVRGSSAAPVNKADPPKDPVPVPAIDNAANRSAQNADAIRRALKGLRP